MKFTDILEDFSGWSIKLCDQQIELRKTFHGDLLLIVNTGGGYEYKSYNIQPDAWGRSTQGVHIHWGSNAPLQLTFDDLEEISKVTNNAYTYLKLKEGSLA